ncbi:DUF6597 domain-containing transcriptional factor [Ekhidna sp.]|uniref:AraC family transcriptional regulator n=1 Tax=Ekhidna sp. TaxID=2608089 RepID=UPI003513B059
MMKVSPHFRHSFFPVQPTIKPGVNAIYKELKPCAALVDYIYCYWQLKSSGPLLDSFNYRVVADGCIDIFFERNNLEDALVMGFSSGHTEFSLSNEFDYIGIRFLPVAFSQLFNIDVSELTNTVELLKEVVPKVSSKMVGSVSSHEDFSQLVREIDDFFLKQLESVRAFDPRIIRAITEITQSNGNQQIENLDIGLSSRQLRRLFNFYVGESPKTFSQVVRFQKILNAKPSVESLKNNKLFYDIGYYDQAHFIKDFKYMYGLTPNIAFK